MSVTIVSAIAIFFVAIALKLLSNFYYGPLSSLPGPCYTRVTGIPLLYSRATGTSREHLRCLHKRYGPVVRVGPTEVSLNSVDGYYKVHGVGSHCIKAPVFDSIRFSHSPMLFTIRDPKFHAQRKRILGRGLAAMKEGQESKIRRLAELAVSNIEKEVQEGKSDVYKWWRCLAVDVISEMSFGKPFELLRPGGQDLPVYKALGNAGSGVVLQVMLPSFLQSLVRWSPITWLRDIARVGETIFGRVLIALNEASLPSCGSSMVRHILGEAELSKSPVLSDEELGSEVSMMLVAGSDSTAATLTYATWAIIRDPDLRRKIEEEVARLPEHFTMKDLDRLPLLNSTLEETLRLYNPAGALVERVLPPSGMSIHGWDLPGGTMVYTTGWLISRLEDVFPDPDMFDATRFMNPSPEQTRAHVPFSIGSRSCIGMQLARMEILVTLATLFRQCRDMKLHYGMTDEMMTQVGEFFIVPKGAGGGFLGLSTWQVIALLIVLILLSLGIFMCMRKKSEPKAPEEDEGEEEEAEEEAEEEEEEGDEEAADDDEGEEEPVPDEMQMNAYNAQYLANPYGNPYAQQPSSATIVGSHAIYTCPRGFAVEW
ncbi:putative sterigmatocystin biosynthesis P450 monooxygenase STCB [Fusarium culmorum]|uniref:Putative sterigmatocystin biosynthesis P450 monooxygenase STCB n=1 Tax=Fusarium culmorum TaxID=5516 RepID=A0A2T4GRX3_FUSCU|nr:putative sterigmatocystin biosynthesis P450 monooxygenase STCB [Fusarium culmorum]